MTYLPESLFQPDSYINSANKSSQRYEVYQVSKYGLFTVNSIKLDVIHLHTLLYISVSRLPSNFIGNITVSSHLFEITCSAALSFLKTISCFRHYQKSNFFSAVEHKNIFTQLFYMILRKLF